VIDVYNKKKAAIRVGMTKPNLEYFFHKADTGISLILSDNFQKHQAHVLVAIKVRIDYTPNLLALWQ